jgi:hypothetical protein
VLDAVAREPLAPQLERASPTEWHRPGDERTVLPCRVPMLTGSVSAAQLQPSEVVLQLDPLEQVLHAPRVVERRVTEAHGLGCHPRGDAIAKQAPHLEALRAPGISSVALGVVPRRNERDRRLPDQDRPAWSG